MTNDTTIRGEPDRLECYQRIREAMTRKLQEYYRRYPERAKDQRSHDAVTESAKGIQEIFTILEDYDLTRRG